MNNLFFAKVARWNHYLRQWVETKGSGWKDEDIRPVLGDHDHDELPKVTKPTEASEPKCVMVWCRTTSSSYYYWLWTTLHATHATGETLTPTYVASIRCRKGLLLTLCMSRPTELSIIQAGTYSFYIICLLSYTASKSFHICLAHITGLLSCLAATWFVFFSGVLHLSENEQDESVNNKTGHAWERSTCFMNHEHSMPYF